MGFEVRLILNINELYSIRNEWNTFVGRNSSNHFLLFEFIEAFLGSKRGESGDPLFFVGFDGKDIVGIAPLIMRKVFGTRLATIYLKPYLSPDFVIVDRFEKEFIECTVDLLFRFVDCRIVDLVFPSESRSLRALIDHCRNRRIHFWTEPSLGHRTLRVEGDDRLLEQSLSRSSRKSFRRAERILREMGSCEILCVEGNELESVGFRKIMEIDKRSWKEEWRAKKGEEGDRDLVDLWNASEQVARNIPDFKRKAWILEMDKRPLAFIFVIQYKKTAYFTKTSYVADTRYEHSSPGMVVRNAALRALFESKSIDNVDFMTDFPYMKRWPTLCRNRTRILLTKGRSHRLAMSLYMNSALRRVLNSTRVASKIVMSKK